MTYREEAIALTRDATAAFGRIAGHRDPKLSQEGLAAHKAELTRVTREQLRAKVEDLSRRATAVADHRRDVANKARPRVATDPAALIRSEQKWNQAKLLLESGRTIDDVLKGADLDTVLAVEEFAPSYLTAKTSKPSGIDGMAFDGGVVDISRQVRARLIHLVPADVAATLREGQAAINDLEQAQPYINYGAGLADGTARGDAALSAAVESTIAAKAQADA